MSGLIFCMFYTNPEREGGRERRRKGGREKEREARRERGRERE